MYCPIRKLTFLRYSVTLVLTIAVLMLVFQTNESKNDTDISEMELPASLRHREPHSIITKSYSQHVPTTKQSAILPAHNTHIPVFVTEGDVNHHDFRYIHSPSNLCDSDTVFLMIYVHSAPSNFKRRMSLRETWGFQRYLNSFNARIVFVMGKVTSVDVMLAIKLESNQYGDIMQEEFLDSYRNLTHKAIGSLKWMTKFCSHARYYLKTDDDIFVNMDNLISYIQNKLETSPNPDKDLLLCHQWNGMLVIRNVKSKWYLSREEFPLDKFPQYCSGSAFLMSQGVVKKLHKATLLTPFFWIDDYYLTGMVFKTLQIPHTRFNEAYVLNYNLEKFNNDTSNKLIFFHVNKINFMYSLWTKVREKRKRIGLH